MELKTEGRRTYILGNTYPVKGRRAESVSKTYRIVLPNDYGSEEDTQALTERFPDLEGEDLFREAFDEIHSLWPGLKMIGQLDFGGLFTADQPPPELPAWAWVSVAE